MSKNKNRPAKYIQVDGTVTEIYPKNGKSFVLKELQELIGGSMTIDIQPLPSGDFMVIDDNGKLINSPKNDKATEIWMKEYPIEKYPLNNDELIVGNAVVSPSRFIK